MSKGSSHFLILLALGLGLASCGKFQREQRAAWRDQAEAQCLASKQVQASAYVSFRPQAIEGPGTCGMTRPLKVSALVSGKVGLSSAATLACPMVPATDRWLEETVQRAAMNVLGAQVIEIKAGSYSCRSMVNNSATRHTSEHAYGNALDVFAFRLSDGREITVKSGWKGSPEEQAFLREAFIGACDVFSTVLGPGHDVFHYDHFHIDLARHNGGRHICKPKVEPLPLPALPPPQPDRSSWVSARAPGPAPLGPMALNATPPGWPPAGPYSPRVQTPAPQIAAGPIEPGPLRLPGSAYMSEELVEGDVDGHGVMDRPADPMQQGVPEAELITPENDPFALNAPPLRR